MRIVLLDEGKSTVLYKSCLAQNDSLSNGPTQHSNYYICMVKMKGEGFLAAIVPHPIPSLIVFTPRSACITEQRALWHKCSKHVGPMSSSCAFAYPSTAPLSASFLFDLS